MSDDRDYEEGELTQEDKLLLERAEKELLRRNISLPEVSALSVDDLCRVIQDLNLHKIELEMQNEELRMSQMALEEARMKYLDLYDFSPVGYLTLDENGQIMDVNLTASRLMQKGKSSLAGQSFARYVVKDDKEIFFRHIGVVATKNMSHTCQLRLNRGGDPYLPVELYSVAIRDRSGNIRCRTSIMDISERLHAHEELRNYYDRLEELVAQRTAELAKANERLLEEMGERKAALKMLKRDAAVNEALAELSGLLLKPATLDEISLLILDYAKRLTASKEASIGYMDGKTGGLATFGTQWKPLQNRSLDYYSSALEKLATSETGKSQAGDSEVTVLGDDGLLKWMGSNKEPFLFNFNVPPEKNMEVAQGEESEGLCRIIYAPALLDEEAAGYVMVMNAPQDYGSNDLNLSRRLATLYAIAIQRGRADQRISSSLQEKEVLMREIFHRTKNNMQVICSLLSLQKNSIEDEQTRQVIQEVKNRILAMAIVHEHLYRGRDLTNVDAKGYVMDLTDRLMESYGIYKGRILLVRDIDPLSISYDALIPCGLLINELMANALKHAFPDGRKGTISISFKEGDGGEKMLVFSDNGIGLPAEVNIHSMQTMGFLIITSLVKDQLDGSIDVQVNQGTTFRITLKLPRYDSRLEGKAAKGSVS